MMKMWKKILVAALSVTMTITGMTFASPAVAAQSGSSTNIIVNGIPEDTVSSSHPVTVDLPNASKGTTVMVQTKDVDGYYLAQVRYSYQNGGKTVYETAQTTNGSASFTKPADQVTVYADYVSVVWDGTIDLTWYDSDTDSFEIQYPAQLAGVATLCNGLFNDIPTREITSGNGPVQIPDLVDEKGNAVGLDAVKKQKKVHGTVRSADGTGYQTFADLDGDGIATTVVGDLSLVDIYNSRSDSGSNNVVTSDNYWYGNEDFTGKTIRLTADINMGGICNGLKTVYDTWSGPGYMPVGGNYCMDPANGYTRLNAGFNGVFDGCGYEVFNIFFDKATDVAGNVTGNFGDCAGCGLIGMLGIPLVELGTQSEPAVRNVAVDGYFLAGRMSGGIIGITGHSHGMTIENCINFATVQSWNGGKGQGGIIGAGQVSPEYGDAQPVVRNCVNFGYVSTGYNKNAGGLVGASELLVSDSYTVGFTAGFLKPDKNGNISGDNREAGNTFGTNNGSAVWSNCYGLESASTTWLAWKEWKDNGGNPSDKFRSGSNGSMPLVYGDTSTSAIREISLDKAKTKEFVSLLNGKVKAGTTDTNGYMDSDDDVILNTKRNWVAASDKAGYISSQVQASLNEVISWCEPGTKISDMSRDGIATALKKIDTAGMPIPAAFLKDVPEVTQIKSTGTPTLEYLSDETFDTGDHTKQASGPNDPDENEFAIWVIYEDGTYSQVTDYTVIYQEPERSAFDAGDTSVTVKVAVGDQTFEKLFSVAVKKADLLTMKIAQQPKNSLYASEEYFSPDGLALIMEYGSKAGVAANIAKKIKIEYSGTKPTVKKYTGTVSGTDQYETLSEEAAAAYSISFDPTPEKKLGKDDKEVTVSHNYSGQSLSVSIPITVLETAVGREENPIIKTAEGTTTIHITNEDEFIWFANQIASNLDPDIYGVLETDLSIEKSDYLPVGVKGTQIIPYSGVFDGNGHTIAVEDLQRDGKGSAGAAALFYKLGSGAEVKNLTVSGNITGSTQTAGIAAYMAGAKITDCMNLAEVTSTGADAGGILAKMESGGGTIEGCANEGTISGVENTGGIAGSVSVKNGMISACRNSGAVRNQTESDKTECTAGGLVGALGTGSVSYSKNTGDVSGTLKTAIGGIVGRTSANTVVQGNYNTGRVSITKAVGTNTVGGVGGIVGRSPTGSTTSNCYSTGAVQSDDSSFSYVGALIGNAGDVSNIINNYGLEGMAAALICTTVPVDESRVAFLSDEKLKLAEGVLNTSLENKDFGYQANCGGYPALYWEEGKAHTPAAAVKENEVVATIDQDGHYDNVVYCAACQAEISRETIPTMVQVPIANTTVTIDRQVYSGKTSKPVIIVKRGSTILKDGTDYTVDYNVKGVDYVNPGNPYVKITGKGRYTGERTDSFLIQFTDVTDTSLFYYPYIYWAVDETITTGYTDGTFRPMGACNRAAVVTFLWRLAGRPDPTRPAPFKDMTDNEEFNKAIAWAAENGITTGWDDNTFRPWNTCNRAAIVTFLWRYAHRPSSGRSASFKDMTGNSDFDQAISWAAEKGITTGWDDNTFRPWNTCNRLAVVSFLSRYNAR